MNPMPEQRPRQLPPRLVDRRSPAPAYVPATVLRGFPADRLTEVERSWGPARERLTALMVAAGLAPETGHWDWRQKVESARSGEHYLIAVECESEVQGILALHTELRRSALFPEQWVVYVDYIESAPWNRREPPDANLPNVQLPRFAGVGTMLIGEAIRVALGRTAGCRVGLHGIPQAEAFYSGPCRMTRIGPDPGYYEYVYFEYPDGVALEWLSDVGLSV